MTAFPIVSSASGPLEPATRAFVDSLAGGTPIYTLSPEAARNVLASAQRSVPVTLPQQDLIKPGNVPYSIVRERCRNSRSLR